MTNASTAKVSYFMGGTPSKWTMYKTAIAGIGAVGVRAGDVVAIEHYDIIDGCHWFMVTATERGPISPVVFPDHHLHSFVL